MPRISYNPQVQATTKAQAVPALKVDQAAAAAPGRALAQIGSVAGDLASSVGGIVRDEREKQNLADMAGLRNEIAKAEALTAEQIKRIPVQDGVNFQQQADSIQRKNFEAVSAWLEAPGNIRNAGVRGVREQFSQTVKESIAGVKNNAAVAGETYEFQKSRDRFKLEIETGIQTGNPAAIRNGIRGRVMIGELSADEAEVKYNDKVKAMNQKLDADDMSMAEVALHAGDMEAFDKYVDGMREPSQAKKAEIKAKGKGTLAYNTAALTLSQLESSEGTRSLVADIESGKEGKAMSASQKRAILVSATGRAKGIERNQYSNARRILSDAAKGEFDGEAFEAMALSDTESGLPQSDIELIRKNALAAVDAFVSEKEDKAFWKTAESDAEYKEINSALTEAALRPQDRSEKGNKALAKKIASSGLDPRLQAKLYGDYLNIRSADLAESEETYKDGIFIKRNRDIKPQERETLNTVFDLFGASLEVIGPRDTLHQELREVDKAVNRFYTDNDPTEEQARAFEATVLRPVYDKMIRARLRK